MKNKFKYTFLIKLFLILVCESYSIADDVLIDAKEIVIGDGRDNQIYLGDKAEEPAVMGDTLADMLSTFCDQAGAEVGNQGFPLAQLKAACATLKSSLDNFKSSVTKVK